MRSYLDQYGEGEENRNRMIIRVVVVALCLAIFGSLSWFLFQNHHQESIVKSFVASIRSGDYQGAYRIWGCGQTKPCPGYSYEKFMGDWGTARVSPDGQPDLAIFGLTDSESCNNGVLLTLAVNSSRTDQLWVDRNRDEISYSPYPVCPHRGPWKIMLQRTVGRLRKPFLR